MEMELFLRILYQFLFHLMVVLLLLPLAAPVSASATFTVEQLKEAVAVQPLNGNGIVPSDPLSIPFV